MQKISYFNSGNRKILESLGRYYKYVLKIYLEKSETWRGCNKIILNENELFDINILKQLIKGKYKIAVFSFYEKRGVINLLDLDNLHIRAQLIHFKPFQTDQYFINEELVKELSYFFKSHGPNSYINKINGMLYALNNYNLCSNAIISRSEYYNEFMRPALKNWNVSNLQIDKYFSIILLLDYSNELKEIENILKDIEKNLFYLTEDNFINNFDIEDKILILRNSYENLLRKLNTLKEVTKNVY